MADAVGAAPDVPMPPHEDGWRAWAGALLLSPETQGLWLPDDRYFDDWKAWAAGVSQAFVTAGI